MLTSKYKFDIDLWPIHLKINMGLSPVMVIPLWSTIIIGEKGRYCSETIFPTDRQRAMMKPVYPKQLRWWRYNDLFCFFNILTFCWLKKEEEVVDIWSLSAIKNNSKEMINLNTVQY